MKKLVIIESPAKARSLKSYLGSQYDILASYGHVRDLPEGRLAVAVDNGFKPTYTIRKENRKLVSDLKNKSKDYREIFLAADPDREGEAICWHLSQLLKGPDRIFHRLRFNAITKDTVLKALEHPDEIDMNLVNAQQARRVMDRLVGYKISPYLWKTVGKGLSAGRVQTGALRLVQDREDEIAAFNSEEYWVAEAMFRQGKSEFSAILHSVDGKKIDRQKNAPHSALEMETLLPRLEKKDGFTITRLERKPGKRRPRTPFITSTLQQTASSVLGFSPGNTMKTAQQLYEGIRLGEKDPDGLITYMRTDSVRVSAEAIRECREFIEKEMGKDFLPPRPRNYRSSGLAQDAHEAIRPTSTWRTPETVKSWLTSSQYKLYSLIWKRFVASQMPDALVERTLVIVSTDDGIELRTSGEELSYPGFGKIDPSQLIFEKSLPYLSKGSVILDELKTEQKFTQPPVRFSEAGLVSEMKKQGIGRPSTYVSIINTLKNRKYVFPDHGSLKPTEIGTTVVRLLIEMFPHLFRISFTAEMEKLLDEIARGKTGYVNALEKLNQPLESSLNQAIANISRIRDGLRKETGENCPLCGLPLLIRWGRYGKFYACKGFPDCRYTRPVESDLVNNNPENRKICPECGSRLIGKVGRFGRYLACENAPHCTHTESFSTGVSCPEENCNGELVERRTKKGKTFYSCNNYPDCKFATWNKPIAEICPKCGYPFLEERKKGICCPRCRKKIKEKS